MLIEKISLSTMAKFIQVKYDMENNVYIDDVIFKLKHKYDNFTWLIEIEPCISNNLAQINTYLCKNIDNVKCQQNYIKNNNIIIKIRTKGDKVLMDTTVNIFDKLDNKDLIGTLYLDQIWLYKGVYHYKWKLDKLRFKE